MKLLLYNIPIKKLQVNFSYSSERTPSSVSNTITGNSGIVKFYSCRKNSEENRKNIFSIMDPISDKE